MNSIKSVIILAVLIVIIRIIGFFAGSETAYLSLSKIKMRDEIIKILIVSSRIFYSLLFLKLRQSR